MQFEVENFNRIEVGIGARIQSESPTGFNRNGRPDSPEYACLCRADFWGEVYGFRNDKMAHAQLFFLQKPKGTPAKADPEKQAEFIRYYENLLNTLPEDEPVEFADAVHPTMATKVTYGWIRKGQDKLIATTASRTRINLLGSINLETMDVTIASHETIDSKAMEKHFAALRKKYPKAPRIHQIVDRGPYNVSAETKAAAEKYGIVLHHLPTYSPNLNPIERLWKVMNEFVRNNRVFKNAVEFRKAIDDFFAKWPEIAQSMVDRINDNFQMINKVSSS